MKAVWNNTILAESEDTVVVDGNHYFPPESLVAGYFKSSNHTSRCIWKGKASYYHIEVDGRLNKNAAWYYPEPKSRAESIRDRVAFWKGVEVCE